MKKYWPIALYIPSTAGAAVYAKISFENVSPFLVTFATFVLCWALFLAINRQRLGRLVAVSTEEKLNFTKLNVYTFLCWVSIFACIKLLSGSVELVVFMSVVPLFTVVAGREWLRIGSLNRWSVVGIAFIAMVVVFVHPQMRKYGVERQAIGLIVGLVAGGFAAVYMVLSGEVQKRHALTSIDLICLRLPLLVAATFVISIQELMQVLSLEFIAKASFLSLVAVVIPAYTLQQSITEIGSIPTSVLMPLVTAVALGFEWAGGLELSLIGVVAILFQCVAIMHVSLSLGTVRTKLKEAPRTVGADLAPKPASIQRSV
jgi:drug/metabolite transporter (DMT)-like permease